MKAAAQHRHRRWLSLPPSAAAPWARRGFFSLALVAVLAATVLMVYRNVATIVADVPLAPSEGKPSSAGLPGKEAVPPTTSASTTGTSQIAEAKRVKPHDGLHGASWLWDHDEVQQNAVRRLFHQHDLSPDTFAASSSSTTHRLDAAQQKAKAIAEQVGAIPQCRALGATMGSFVAQYIHSHYYADSGGGGGPADASAGRPTLIYSCESNKKGHFCGGMGDRFRGMISSLFLAMLTNRRFQLYHPRPVPIQQYLEPHLINFIPTVAISQHSATRRQHLGNAAGAISFADVEAAVTAVPVDLQLMSIKKHRKYIQYLASAAGRAKHTIRLQSNSYGVDGFVHAVPELDRVKRSAMGLSPACNISCYYGCLYHTLFRPSELLETLMAATLDGQSSIETLEALRKAQPGDAAAMGSPHARAHGMTVDPAVPSTGRRRMGRRGPDFVIGMQVRIGGPWASGLAIPEPFRTPPSAVPHFFAFVAEVLQLLGSVLPTTDESFAASAGQALRDDAGRVADKVFRLLPNALRLAQPPVFSAERDPSVDEKATATKASHRPQVVLFVSSDAPLFVNKTRAAFGTAVSVATALPRLAALPFDLQVRWVDGDSFTHTDSGDLAAMRPEKFTAVPTHAKHTQYVLTLLNHCIIARAHHVVMAQSGFGDTAFWASRSSASCLFVDMTNGRWAWQHHLAYDDPAAASSGGPPRSAQAAASRIVDLQTAVSDFYTHP